MKRRCGALIFGLLLAFCFSFYIAPVVSAEDWVTVNDETELKTQLALGGNIKLGADITIDDNITTSEDLTLDLNGRTLTTNKKGFIIESNVTIQDETGSGKVSGNKTYLFDVGGTQPGTLTLKSGTITNIQWAAVATNANGTFIMDDGRVNSAGYTIYNDGRFVMNGGYVYGSSAMAVRMNDEESTMEMNGGTLQSDGADIDTLHISRGEVVINSGTIIATSEDSSGIVIFGNSKLTINDVNVQAKCGALSGNGTVSPREQNYGGNVTLIINGGTFNGGEYGLYLPQPNSTTVINGGTFIGEDMAVEIRASKVDINGGTFIATKPTFEIKSNRNGTTASGTAVAVAQHTTKQELELTIRGGTFSGAVPVSEANPENNDAESIAKVKVRIVMADNGTIPEFTSTTGTMVYAEDLTGFISAGLYSDEIEDKYVDPEYIQEAKSNDFIVKKKSEEIINPETSDTLFQTIIAALASISGLFLLAIEKISRKSSTSA